MKELSVKQEILITRVKRLVAGQILGSVGHLVALWKKSAVPITRMKDSQLFRFFLSGDLFAHSLGKIELGQAKMDTTIF